MNELNTEPKIYYKNGFYHSEIHAVIPEDAVEITREIWLEMIRKQSLGYRIEADSSGAPVAVLPSERPLAELKAEAEKKLWSNYKKYQQKYVDAEDLTLATLCASQGSVKGKAVQLWVMDLWARYYTAKDAVFAAADRTALDAVDLTAESYGPPPYTIRELNEEAAAALNLETQGA
jgi:hypothetical protein